MEDSQILDLFFARSEDALAETERKYGSRLLRISQNIVESRLDAEECVNDTYAAAWNQIPPERPAHYFAYLGRIVRNISFNLFHRNTAQKRSANIISLEEELNEIIPDTKSFDSGESELGAAIDRFLRCQDKSGRYLFVRRYFYGDSIASLSASAGLAESAVAMRLMRMRKKLKTYLEKEGFAI